MKRTNARKARIATIAAGLMPSLVLAHHGLSDGSELAASALPPGGADHAAGFVIVGLLLGVGLVATCVLRRVTGSSPR